VSVDLTVRVPDARLLGHGESRAFSFQRGPRPEQGFVLRWGDELVAYVNRCPHWGVELDLGDERFYAADIDRIYCTTHGALFRPATGECDAGPCSGDSLEALPFRLEGDDAVVTIPRLELRA
jgi:nitrite reductase/ring-hydroxylating ferredoxin subunit